MQVSVAQHLLSCIHSVHKYRAVSTRGKMAQSKMSTKWRIPSTADLKKCERMFSQFVIRVLKEDEKGEAKQLVTNALFKTKDDPIISELQFDAVSKQSLIECCIEPYFDQNIAFGCFLKENTLFPVFNFKQGKKIKQDRTVIQMKMVAVDVLYVRHLLDEFPKPSKDSGEAFVNLMKCTKRIEQKIWSKGALKICSILTSFGVFFTEEYKNRELILEEMIYNRKNVAVELRIEVLGRACIGKELEQAKTEANTYKPVPAKKGKENKDKAIIYEVLHIFRNDDSKELGLDNIFVKDLKPIFPIVIMGAKQKLITETVAEIRDKARRKKPKRENEDN